MAEEQVRRDHAISHVLAALSANNAGDVIFFGGTALSRTHLVHARLSEDIDRIANGPRGEVAERLTASIEAALLRSHGRVTWRPGLAAGKDIDPALLEVGDTSIKMQLLDGQHYSKWPVEQREMEQRYEDVAPAVLTVPTIDSFAGWKTAAWHDRGAPRDLYDLWALAERGALTSEAADLFAKHAPLEARPANSCSRRRPPRPHGRTNTGRCVTKGAGGKPGLARAQGGRRPHHRRRDPAGSENSN